MASILRQAWAWASTRFPTTVSAMLPPSAAFVLLPQDVVLLCIITLWTWATMTVYLFVVRNSALRNAVRHAAQHETTTDRRVGESVTGTCGTTFNDIVSDEAAIKRVISSIVNSSSHAPQNMTPATDFTSPSPSVTTVSAGGALTGERDARLPHTSLSFLSSSSSSSPPPPQSVKEGVTSTTRTVRPPSHDMTTRGGITTSARHAPSDDDREQVEAVEKIVEMRRAQHHMVEAVRRGLSSSSVSPAPHIVERDAAVNGSTTRGGKAHGATTRMNSSRIPSLDAVTMNDRSPRAARGRSAMSPTAIANKLASLLPTRLPSSSTLPPRPTPSSTTPSVVPTNTDTGRTRSSASGGGGTTTSAPTPLTTTATAATVAPPSTLVKTMKREKFVPAMTDTTLVDAVTTRDTTGQLSVSPPPTTSVRPFFIKSTRGRSPHITLKSGTSVGLGSGHTETSVKGSGGGTGGLTLLPSVRHASKSKSSRRRNASTSGRSATRDDKAKTGTTLAANVSSSSSGGGGGSGSSSSSNTNFMSWRRGFASHRVAHVRA